MFAGGNHLMFKMAGILRKQSTHTEEILWTYLSKKPLGYKFRRQHVYAVYVLDFFVIPYNL
jgi:leucyl-tRNA synthetase